VQRTAGSLRGGSKGTIGSLHLRPVGEGTVARLTALSSRSALRVLVAQVTILVEEAISVGVEVAGQVSRVGSEAAAPVTIHGVRVTAGGVTTSGDDSG
jgi:hypothetical protein